MPLFAITRKSLQQRRGNILIFVLVSTLVVAALITVVLQQTTLHVGFSGQRINTQTATRIAESGIEKAVWCLNNPGDAINCPNNPSFTGETNVPFAGGSYSTQVTLNGSTATVTASGTIRGVGGTTTRELSVTITQAASLSPSFQYGVQAGKGGITLSNNAKVIGNAYTNGSIIGSNGSSITGDAVLAVSDPTIDQVSDPNVSPLTLKNLGESSTTQYLAQSFVASLNDGVYSVDLKLAKHNNPTTTITAYIYSDNNGAPDSNLSGGGQAITVSVPNDSPAGWENGWTNQLFSPNTVLLANTTYWLVLRVSGNNATKYWSTVRGSDDSSYLSGTAKVGSSLAGLTSINADIAFRINVGGQTPTLSVSNSGGNVGIGGNAYAYTISNTSIFKKAYYKALTGTVKANNGADTCIVGSNGPNCFDDSPNQPPQNLPISQAQILQMEAMAVVGGTTTCSPTCTITNGSSIGPRKYVGDLVLDGTITLTGTVWVEGNITITNSSVLKLASGYGVNSGTIIADEPLNPDSGGKITLSNGGDLTGNYASCVGTPKKCSAGTKVGQACSVSTDCPNGNYIMAISNNADPSFTIPAIDVSNNLTAGVLYAPNGLVAISNNANLSEVTAQKISLANNCQITYQSGLASSIFTSGPGGSWVYQPGSYQIIR